MMRFAMVVYFLGLSVWVGGLAVLGPVVAPVVFHKASRNLAGDIFGTTLRVFSYVEIVCAVLVAGGGAAPALAARPFAGWEIARVALLVLLILVFAAYTFWLHPAIREVRPACGDFDEDPADEAQAKARERFDALHQWSERLVGANLFIGLALLALSAAILPPARP